MKMYLSFCRSSTLCRIVCLRILFFNDRVVASNHSLATVERVTCRLQIWSSRSKNRLIAIFVVWKLPVTAATIIIVARNNFQYVQSKTGEHSTKSYSLPFPIADSIKEKISFLFNSSLRIFKDWIVNCR